MNNFNVKTSRNKSQVAKQNLLPYSEELTTRLYWSLVGYSLVGLHSDHRRSSSVPRQGLCECTRSRLHYGQFSLRGSTNSGTLRRAFKIQTGRCSAPVQHRAQYQRVNKGRAPSARCRRRVVASTHQTGR